MQGDYVALPAEHRTEFSESLILMPPCYIANDYAQMRGKLQYSTVQYSAIRYCAVQYSNV